MLSKETQERIDKEAIEYASGMMGVPHLTSAILEHFADKQLHSNLERAYRQGAVKETERSQALAQILVEALEAWQKFDVRIHYSVIAAELHMRGKVALDQYRDNLKT